MELSSHFEGSTFKERVTQEAATTLKHASYSGPKHNFTFVGYYTLHARAYTKLLRVDKHMTVEQQINGFIQSIQCATAQSIVINLAGDQADRISFDSYYNAVASRLELSLSLTHKITSTENRHVNEVNQKRTKQFTNNNNDTNKRQKLSTKRGEQHKGGQNHFIPELKVYDISVWNNLSNTNRDDVRDLYRKEKKNNRSGQNSHLHTHNTPQSQSHPQFIPYVNRQQNNSAGLIQDRSTSKFSLQNYLTMNPYHAIQAVLLPYPGTLIMPSPPPIQIIRQEAQ